MSEQNLEQLLMQKQFDQAFSSIQSGEKLSKNIPEHQKSQILERLFSNEQYEIINELVAGKWIETDVYEFDSFDKSVFGNMIWNLKNDDKALGFFQDFISKCDNINDEVEAKTLINYFLEKGVSVEKIKILIDTGCDINFTNNAEENLIHQVIKTNLMKPQLSIAYLELLINEGLDVNAVNIVNKTPLIAAIEFNKPEYLDILLQNGANPNELDQDGNSAFFYAVAQKQDLNIYLKIRDFGSPDFDTINKNGVNTLFEFLRMMYASEKNLELLSTMISDGADIYQASTYYSKEKTPIDLIAEKQPEILQAVLDSGSIDVNRQDNHGNTLLHKVCAYNVNFEAEKAKETYKKVKLLLENGADVSISNDEDKTPLMLASDDNLKIKTVELLMKNA
ncbi:ankyrin repeat domain-containing protein [Pedobacter sp. N23S346]|uniref:ankyrin repeat domain-containing protein n=1 Tax=Pedobacter sp. N23S346 TaxID=3402750 RepID=UPI003ABE2BEF